MAASRVRLVARVGSGGSPLQTFMVVSALVHVVLAAGLILAPRLFGRGPKIPPNAMIVELAPDLFVTLEEFMVLTYHPDTNPGFYEEYERIETRRSTGVMNFGAGSPLHVFQRRP